MVVQAAVGDLRGLEEAPHICIRPAQDRVHPHEGRPARAAGAELVLPARIRIPSAAQHSSVSGTCHAVAVMYTQSVGCLGSFLPTLPAVGLLCSAQGLFTIACCGMPMGRGGGMLF